MFPALKKLELDNNSDSKPGVVVSTQARLPAKGRRRQSQLQGVRGHAPPGIFCFKEGFRCLLVISKGL